MGEQNNGVLDWFRPSEWVVLSYFTYTGLMALQYPLPAHQKAAGLAAPLLLFLLGYIDSFNPKRWTSMVRDWLPAPLVLAAYWQVNWFQVNYHLEDLEQMWLGWDRHILYQLGLHSAMESFGKLLPSIVELAYLLMYVIPPFALATFYILRKREKIEQYAFPFLLGTLSCYALIPHFPTGSPRVEHAGIDLPSVMTIFRQFNIWILTHGDIQTSVFPSGHVTAAFSAAFGMILALPEHPWIGRLLLSNAILILIATVYGRYHYAADGIAGLAISFTALCVTVYLRRAESAEKKKTQIKSATTAASFPEAS